MVWTLNFDINPSLVDKNKTMTTESGFVDVQMILLGIVLVKTPSDAVNKIYV